MSDPNQTQGTNANAAGSAAGAASGAAQTGGTAATGAAGTSTTTAPAAGEEYKNMSPEAFKQRLEAERNAGLKAFLASVGVPDAEALKKSLGTLKQLEDAKLSAEERAAKQLDELKPKAARADDLDARLAKILEAEEAQIDASKKSVLDLAPPAGVERLEWIAKAKAKGLFKPDAAATATNTTTTANAASTTPVNTQVGVTPPAGGGPPPAKRPKDMTDAEFAQFQAQRRAARQSQ